VEVEPSDVDVAAPERYWRVRPQKELPLDTRADLVARKGLLSLEGPLPSKADALVVSTFTFPAHGFLGVRCFDLSENSITVRAGDELPARPCNPMEPVELLFASPVVKEVLQHALELDPDLAGGREDYDPWDALYSGSRLEWARSGKEEYSIRLPELLRARTTYHLRANAAVLLDEFGRPLPQDVDFLFTTSDRPPRAALTHPVSTLEKNVETRVPVVVTNLDSLSLEVEALTADGVSTRSETISLPKAPNVAFRYPLPTREWLSGRSGALFANVAT
jgi:hypothetical protein